MGLETFFGPRFIRGGSYVITLVHGPFVVRLWSIGQSVSPSLNNSETVHHIFLKGTTLKVQK